MDCTQISKHAFKVPGSGSPRPGIPGPGFDLDALGVLKLDLFRHIDTRFEALTSEFRTLQTQMSGEFREDLLRALSSAQPAPLPTPARQESTATELLDPEAQQVHLLGSLGSTKPQPDEERKPLTCAPGSYGFFQGRANLHAYVMAKNWDSEILGDDDFDSSTLVVSEKSQPPNKLQKLLRHPAFDMVVAGIITANALVMAVSLEYEGIFSADAIGLPRDAGSWHGAETTFFVLENIFTIVFLAELVLRLAAEGCNYFRAITNWLDFLIVGVSVCDLLLYYTIDAQTPNLAILKLLRVFRIMRVLRIVRMLKFFYQLRVLISSVQKSLAILGWSMIVLGLIVLIAAIFMTMSLQQFLRDPASNQNHKEQIYSYFGSFSRSCISMFEITMAPGVWGKVGRTIVYEVNRAYAVFFVLYLSGISFAMMKVITAVFIKETLQAANKDADQVMAETHKDPKYIANIQNAFNYFDEDGDGQVTLEELSRRMCTKEAKYWLRALDVSRHEMVGLFVLMDDGDDELSFIEFLTGVMRLKNCPKGVDVATILYENKKILKRLLNVGKDVRELRKQVEAKTAS